MPKLVLAVLVFTMPAIALAQAEQGARGGKWEFSIGAVFQQSKSLGSDGGSSLSIDDTNGWGTNIGYNVNAQLNLSVDLDFLKPRYTAVLVDEMDPGNTTTINHKASQFNGRFKGTYYLFTTRFSPFFEAGFGWSEFDSNVATGPPITGCWWHPWWGLICSDFYNTFTETSFSYGVGAGVRHQFSNDVFIKAGINIWDYDSLGMLEDPTMVGGRIEFGWLF